MNTQPLCSNTTSPSTKMELSVQRGGKCGEQAPVNSAQGQASVALVDPAPNATQPLVPSESFALRVGG